MVSDVWLISRRAFELNRYGATVLESDNYMRYALGITTTFSLISRLDRIVVICKTYGLPLHVVLNHSEC